MNESSYIAATNEAMNKAYVPYSNYPVAVSYTHLRAHET